jgi:hypothetical protein
MGPVEMRFAPRIALALLAIVAVGCTTPNPGSSAVASSAPASITAGSPAGGAPLGTWSMTVSAADMEAAGFTDAGLIGENTGTFTLTVAPDGTWTMAQSTTVPVRWPVFRGKYSVTGSRTFEMTTEFPADYAGDVVTVDWSLDAGNLRLRLVAPDDPLLRLQLEAHPWAPLP